MTDRVLALGRWLLGPSPSKDAPASERLRWIRRFYLRPLPLTAVIYALAIVWASSTWAFILLLLAALLWLQGVVSISLRIRREARQEQK